MSSPRMKMKLCLKVTFILCTLITSVYSQSDFDIRLSGGISSYEGLLEIYYDGEWGTVCDDGWDENDARVVCHQLGFGEPMQTSTGYYGDESQPILLDDVQCNGWESKLSLCSHATIGVHDCTHSEDVALKCSTEEDFTVRLVDGIYANVGRLEIYYNGEWSQVCNSQWTDTNSEIVCHQLGYLRADDWVDGYYISDGEGPYPFDFFYCDGSEDSLVECSRSYSTYVFCYYDPVTLQCTNEDDYHSQGDARLVGSYSDDGENEGIVEVYLYGTWGTICSTYWSYDESETLCKQLGFQTGELVDIYHYDTTVVSHLPIHEVTFDCYGDEYHLSDCTYNTEDIGYCSHSEDVALTCEKYDTGGLSGGAIAGITIGSFVGFYFLYAWLCGKKNTNQAATNNVTTNPPATSIPLELQNNGNQDVEPSAPPAMTEDLPPAYDHVIAEPDMYKSPIETPPPAYIGYSSPLNQGADNQAT